MRSTSLRSAWPASRMVDDCSKMANALSFRRPRVDETRVVGGIRSKIASDQRRVMPRRRNRMRCDSSVWVTQQILTLRPCEVGRTTSLVLIRSNFSTTGLNYVVPHYAFIAWPPPRHRPDHHARPSTPPTRHSTFAISCSTPACRRTYPSRTWIGLSRHLGSSHPLVRSP